MCVCVEVCVCVRACKRLFKCPVIEASAIAWNTLQFITRERGGERETGSAGQSQDLPGKQLSKLNFL